MTDSRPAPNRNAIIMRIAQRILTKHDQPEAAAACTQVIAEILNDPNSAANPARIHVQNSRPAKPAATTPLRETRPDVLKNRATRST